LVILTAAVTLLLLPFPAHAFAPKHHFDAIMEPLDGAGFSEGMVWLSAFFSIEVDMYDIPDGFCWFPIRWPTWSYACAHSHDPHLNTDPCVAGGRFSDWVEWCLPFHNCRTSYPIGSWNGNPVEGLDAFTQMRRLWSVQAAMHMAPGERCYDVMRRFGYMLHAVADFYAHSNWVEVFHMNLGFEFEDIPTWTSFQKAQRGEELNLILLQHAGLDVTKAITMYHQLDDNLQQGISNADFVWHDRYGKDSSDIGHYSSDNREFHEDDDDGDDVLDYFEEAKFLAGTETYQLGLELRSNVLNNPELGEAAWKNLFYCVDEIAAFDGQSYESELAEYRKGIGRLKTYSSSLPYVRAMCALVVSTSFLTSQYPPFAALAALCKLVPDQMWK
jgi:hypothetical protein